MPRLKIDADLLIESGYGALSADQADTLLREFYEALEEMVGLDLAGRMSNKQLDQFEGFFEREDDEGAFMWLESNFSDYQDIVRKQYDDLVEVLRAASEGIS
jgi:Protein of unknown function (DUF5663)